MQLEIFGAEPTVCTVLIEIGLSEVEGVPVESD